MTGICLYKGGKVHKKREEAEQNDDVNELNVPVTACNYSLSAAAAAARQLSKGKIYTHTRTV